MTTAVPVAFEDELRTPVTVRPATSIAGAATTVQIDPTVNPNESFRTYIKDGTVLQPGEFRVFSSSSKSPQPLTRLTPLAVNSFDFLGGFSVVRPEWGTVITN